MVDTRGNTEATREDAAIGGGRIAFLSDSAEFGGAEVSMVILAEHMPTRYEFIAVLSDAAAAETRERLARAGAKLVEVAGLRRRPTPASVIRLVGSLRRISPTVVHINATDQGDGLTGLLAARILRLPTILNIRNVIPGRSPMRELLSRWALRRADIALGPSEFVGAYLTGIGARAHVVTNGVPAPSLDPGARASLGIEESAFVVGGIGRLHQQKGWDVLCEAAQQVRARLPGAIFVVVGEGDERARLTARPSCRNIRFVGYRSAASSLLGAFDVLVMPSRYEAFGRVAVEAMLAGVPIVASAVQALPEVLDEHAVLVPPDDSAALAQAIVALAEDSGRRTVMGPAARMRAEELFDVRRMAAETAATYDLLAHRRNARSTG
jgi:glycosyltransferase involved in cell wall biosynthesis